MESISKTNALNVLSRWDRQNQTVSVFCFSPHVTVSSKNVRIALNLDECLTLSLAEITMLRIIHAEANFYRVGEEKIPTQFPAVLPEFREGLRVDFHDKQMQWFLLAVDDESQAVNS